VVSPASNFCETLKHLRHYEEFVLFGLLSPFNEKEDQEITAWLLLEYEDETKGYPYAAPAFDEAAALWAAKTIYTAGQLLLHREHRLEAFAQMLPSFPGELNAGTILSADIMLRFLPDLISQLDNIDADDSLIPLLEALLTTWHYSGLSYSLPDFNPSFDTILSNKCLRQLYLDRIIFYKNLSLAKHPMLKPHVNAVLGIYADEYWREFSKAFQ
jgi:hypothetical protein